MAKAKATGKKRETPTALAELERLAGGEPLVSIDRLTAGYGRMEVVHDLSLRLARGQAGALPYKVYENDLRLRQLLAPARLG